jgi:hypothetical protein
MGTSVIILFCGGIGKAGIDDSFSGLQKVGGKVTLQFLLEKLPELFSPGIITFESPLPVACIP